MKIGLRILLGYFAIVALAAWLLSQVFVQQIKPGVRQAMEDTLIDTANMLAELAADDLQAGRMADGQFARRVRAVRQRDVGAEISGFSKLRTNYRVTVTDARGIVVFDSDGLEVGRDNSKWNDVHRTLRGQYGARSTRTDPQDDNSSVMYVAAPVRAADGRMIGVLTVSKPNRIVAPFIERSQRKVLQAGMILMAAALLAGVLAAWWLSRQLRVLRRYADAVTAGQRAPQPRVPGEFGELGNALHTMRERLEGKQYVEEYVHTLTHELKSPLSAIRGSAEVLHDAGARMTDAERAQFIATIHGQSERMAQMVDKLLALAAVEHRQRIEQPQRIDLHALLADAREQALPRATAAQVGLQVDAANADTVQVSGDAFLLRQALLNLIDNAIDFSPAGAAVRLQVMLQDDGQACIVVRDQGSGIPDYARERVFERFYSLPRPDGRSRSSGLGLPFVAQVAELHHGRVSLKAGEDGIGTQARLCLPSA